MRADLVVSRCDPHGRFTDDTGGAAHDTGGAAHSCAAGHTTCDNDALLQYGPRRADVNASRRQ